MGLGRGEVGRELGGVEGSETVARMHCMRKKYIFNKKERKMPFIFIRKKFSKIFLQENTVT